VSIDPLDLATRVVAEARAAGADEADATVTVAQRFSAEARDATLAKLEQSTARALVLRVFTRGAKATLGTSDLSPGGLRELVREVVEASRFVAADPLGGLPEGLAGSAVTADLGIDFEDVRARTPEGKIEDARALERLTRAFDARIVNSGGSRVGDTSVTVALANSHGFTGSYRATAVSRGTSPIARDGESKRVGSYGSAARSYAGLETVEMVATLAARRAVESIGSRKPGTMTVPVIFERDVAAAVLGDLFGALSASSVSTGNSFFAGKTGERVGSALATIVDDGRLPGALGSSPFDSEGVPTRRTVVIDRGVLATYLYDTYYARKLGAATTGNASGGGIGPNSFYLEAGTASLEEVIAATPRGVLVTDTIGFATESVTGTYSRGARGFMIAGGEIAGPIDGFTIASNLLTMLAGIDLVASDLRFDSSIVSPSFRVAEMTVSGTS